MSAIGTPAPVPGVRTRPMEAADWPAVEEIYREGIATGQATFESAPPATWEDFSGSRPAAFRLVAVDEGSAVLGWVAATRVSARDVYRGVIEHSVYVHPRAAGRGVAGVLLRELIRVAEDEGIWTIQGSLFPENTASVRLHESAGFRVVGRRERIALMTYGPFAGQWRDTVIVERRSPVADPR